MAKPMPTTNPWDKIEVKKGKLVGMLTDELASYVMPIEAIRPNHTTIATVHVPSNRGRKPFRKL